MAEEKKDEGKLELKLKFSPLDKKREPEKKEPVPVSAAAPAPDMVEVKIKTPAVSKPDVPAAPAPAPDGKPAEKVDMSSKTVPHRKVSGKTESEKAYRSHVFKCWFYLVIAPVLLILLTSLAAAAYLFYLIMVEPKHAGTVRTSLASIRTNGISYELLKTMFVPGKKKKKVDDDNEQHGNVEYDSRSGGVIDYAPSSGSYGGGGRNNPYNVSRHRQRINNINSQHNKKFEQDEKSSRRKNK